MRYASLEERKQFYTSEFDLQKAGQWFGSQQGRVKFAVIIGRHTKIYPEKYREDASTTIIVDEYSSLEDVRQQILEFLPEAVYYDRNVYDQGGAKTGQELAFDLDPENITCPIHGSLADKMKRQQGLSFCEFGVADGSAGSRGAFGFSFRPLLRGSGCLFRQRLSSSCFGFACLWVKPCGKA